MERVRVIPDVGGPSLTKQAMAEQCDINAIVARHVAHRIPLPEGAPTYGDFTDIGSYQDCLTRVQSARDEFFRLPADIRKYCDNNPGKFLDLVFTEEGRKKFKEMGMSDLVVPEAAKPPPQASTPPASGSGA